MTPIDHLLQWVNLLLFPLMWKVWAMATDLAALRERQAAHERHHHQLPAHPHDKEH